MEEQDTSPGAVEPVKEDHQNQLPEQENETSTEVQEDTTHNSFSKFNYIFYFIYKYKYENRSVGLDNLKDYTLMD